MNKNIIKLAVPAIIVAMGVINTGCVATRCYEGYTTAGYETTYITTPTIETTYVAPPIIETVYEPIYVGGVHHNPPPRPRHEARPQPKAQQVKTAPHREARPQPKAQQVKAAPHREARPQPKAQQVKAAPHQKPAAHSRRK